jgi:hypothetical protein
MGGTRRPKPVPQDEGYTELRVDLSSDEGEFRLRRALAGGEVSIHAIYAGEADYALHSPDGPDGESSETLLDEDVGDLLVRLSGASGMQVLRSASKRGGMTGADLRHWFLLSQPAMISEDATSGSGYGQPQRLAAFHVFLSGVDDSSIVLSKSKAEVQQIAGQIIATEKELDRARSILPEGLVREELRESLGRLDDSLYAISQQHKVRSKELREIRHTIGTMAGALRGVRSSLVQSAAMLQRFELLANKYRNDISRLGAVQEGVAYFETLPEAPCPLCGTHFANQPMAETGDKKSRTAYIRALGSEVSKIESLLSGLSATTTHERSRVERLTAEEREFASGLSYLEQSELQALQVLQGELRADPQELAMKRTEVSAQLDVFDEIDRLGKEVALLKGTKRNPRTTVTREAAAASEDVSDRVLRLLQDWGLSDVKSVSLDGAACDLIINGRARLSYGAGRRSVFLAALSIGLMEHCLAEAYPHLGVLVIDSPLKAYADPEAMDEEEVPLSTVRDGFYAWLDAREALGQVIVLENEKVNLNSLTRMKPIEFDTPGSDRRGFFP